MARSRNVFQTPVRTQTLRVLLIEDSPGDAQLFEEEARDGGLRDLEVTHATRVDEALRLYEPGAFDLILLDLNLPDAKGIRTVERVTSAAIHAPVVVLTTLADESLAEQAIAAGAEDYLVKGESEPWQVARSLRNVVARSRRGFDRAPMTRGQADASLEPSVPSGWFAESSLRSGLPSVFDDLVLAVGDLIDALATCPAGSEKRVALPLVQSLGTRLAMLAATPRDVLDLHRAAASRKLLGSAWGGGGAQSRASRWALVSLLAETCLAYRREALDESAPPNGAT